MTEKIVKNLALSIRTKLLNHAKEHHDDFQRVLTRYAIERLLFRLSQSVAVEYYVLKGAMLFATWPKHVYRPTGDLDLLGEGASNPTALKALFTTICQGEGGNDGIVFDSATLKVEPVREDDKYQGARLLIKADLAGAKITVQVDIGFGDYVYPNPEKGNFPTLLPGLPEPKILMYPRETVVAEKFAAMISFGETNTRIKDFYDVWVITQIFSFDLATIVEAIRGTLHRRELAIPIEMPQGLKAEFAIIVEKKGLWSGFLRRTLPALKPPSFIDLQSELRNFFRPVLRNLNIPVNAQCGWEQNAGVWRIR